MKTMKIDYTTNKVELKGKIVEKGQWIQLSDLLRDDLKATKYWDMALNEPVNICVPSDKDFSTVQVFVKNETNYEINVLFNLHRLLSLSFFQIKDIVKSEDVFYLMTDNLLIDIEKALSFNEIRLISKRKVNDIKDRKVDMYLIENLILNYDNYDKGLFSDEEMLRSLELQYSHYMIIQEKWKIKHKIPVHKI